MLLDDEDGRGAGGEETWLVRARRRVPAGRRTGALRPFRRTKYGEAVPGGALSVRVFLRTRVALDVALDDWDGGSERAVDLPPMSLEIGYRHVRPAGHEFDVLDAVRRDRTVLDEIFVGEHQSERLQIHEAGAVFQHGFELQELGRRRKAPTSSNQSSAMPS